MSGNGQEPDPEEAEPELRTRPVGGTEYSWCKAVPGGTGVTALALLLSKPPDILNLQNALHKLQNSHAILRSKLRFTSASNTFSFVTSASPQLQFQVFDRAETETVVPVDDGLPVSRYHLLLEHEINKNPWSSPPPPPPPSDFDTDLFFVSVYTLSETRWATVLRLHTAACDRAAAVALLKELIKWMGGGGAEKEMKYEEEVSLGIEEMVPREKANKPFWARGMDMLGYSLNSFRLSNLRFVDTESPRCSQVLRLQLNPDVTERLLAGCKSRDIKLCGALAAAALIAAYSSKELPEHQREKYAVVTLVDCRSTLDPPLSKDHLGFYHAGILNTHDISANDKLWELANRTYMAFANAKNNNKHFTDMNDLNFLMCKAIENPGLTPSRAMRTAFISVFEELLVDESNPVYEEFGVDDFVGCASVHGVGPTLAIFDTIRDGRLDCACVYPSPLHSREQMQKLIDDMKKILVDGCGSDEESES